MLYDCAAYPTRHHSTHPRGISLVELLIIVTLMGIIGGISMNGLFKLRDSMQVKGESKTVASLIQDARSKAKHNLMVSMGNENCAMQAYRITIQTATSPIEFDLDGIPHSSCAISTLQRLRSHTISQTVDLATTPTNLGRIEYSVPSGQVAFFSATGTPLTQGSVSLDFQTGNGAFNRTLTIDALRGYPEIGNP